MSVRRSSRANKGQHSKRIDEINQLLKESTTKSTKSSKFKSMSPATKFASNSLNKDTKLISKSDIIPYTPIPNESVRCLVCNTTDLNYNEDEDSNGDMIECDNCHTWQHISCMNLNINKLPDTYLCNVCNLNTHVDQKPKISYPEYLCLRLPDKFKLKKEKHVDGEESDEEEFEEVEDIVDSGALVDHDDEYKYTESTNSHKKRHSPQQLEIRRQVKKVKPNSKLTKSPKFEISNIRQNIISKFKLKLKELIPLDISDDILKGRTIDDLCNEWSIILENGIFETTDSIKYNERIRSLLLNLKISNLINRVINGEFKIEQLPKLTNDEMKTDKDRLVDENIKLKALNQVVIKNVPEIPIIKHTRKGEEIIGDQDYQFTINDKRNDEVELIKEKKKEELEEKVEKVEHHYHRNSLNDVFINSNNDIDQDDDDDVNDNVNGDHSNIEFKDGLDDEMFDNIINDNDNTPKQATLHNHHYPNPPASRPLDTPPPPSITPPATQPSNLSSQSQSLTTGNLRVNENLAKCDIEFICSTNKSKINANKLSKIIIDNLLKKEIELINIGRLNSRDGDRYLDKITNTRDLYFYELKANNDDHDNLKFFKIWSFFNSVSKYGVIKNSINYIKDIYLLSLNKNSLIDSFIFSKFNNDSILDYFDNIKDDEKDYKIYLVFVIHKDIQTMLKLNEKRDDKAQRKEKEQTQQEKNSVSHLDNNNNNNNNNADDGDDDYDPSTILSKLNNTNDNNTNTNTNDNANTILQNLLQNLN